MKNLLIILLFGIILGLAFLTRPSQRSFDFVLAQQLEDRATSASAKSFPSPRADLESSTSGVTFKDRYLWVDIQKDGKTLYTGAFGHWFQWGQVFESPAEKLTIKLPV